MKNCVILLVVMMSFIQCKSKQDISASAKLFEKDNVNISSSDGFTINGILDTDDVKKVKLMIGRKVVTTADVIDHKFVLKGKVEKPIKAMITAKKNSINQSIILENEEYTFHTDKGYAFVEGGKLHEEVLGFISNPEYVALNREMHRMEEEAFSGIKITDHKALKKARAIMVPIENRVFNYENIYLNNIIENGSSTYAKLFALGESYDWDRYPVQKRFALLNQYEKDLGEHPEITLSRKILQEDIDREASGEEVANGMPFKNIKAKDKDGNEINLEDVIKKNDFTILEFWASWCSPCRAEIPNLKNAYAKYKKDGLEIVSVSVDSNSKPWIKALDKEQTTWINTIVEGGFDNKYVKEYGVSAIPASYLISREGVIVASNNELREDNLDKTLDIVFSR